jgi:hypothetical protein
MASRLLLVIIGALLMYIVLDVAENGRLDAGLYQYVQAAWHDRSPRR